ncbi:TonB-dependent receptor plug domain-containing protein, partial [bacterium]|nr:TonB-dependent receptor plug domain-containing protein [bacterium]
MNERMLLRIAVLLAIASLTSSLTEIARAASHTSSAAVVGRIEDARTGEGLGWSSVWLEQIRHGVSSHADGSFHLYRIPPGDYTLRVNRVGYLPWSTRISVAAGDTLAFLIFLSPSRLELEEVELLFEEEKDDDGSVVHNPVIAMGGDELQRELSTTIAETMEEQPGVALRSMGPAPARPVLRGLSGDRLLMLEDGNRTGDLSATSSDHAVAIEPMTAQRIELIRGPEVFLHGSGVLGGVVNVDRGVIETGALHRVAGQATVQGQSVNEGASGGLSLSAPLGPASMKLDGSMRHAGDVQTPDGTLVNTGIATTNLAGGLSYPDAWGVVGIGGTWYDSEYGIPGGFVGAHPNGVDIEMERRGMQLLGRLYFQSDIVRRLDTEYTFSRYYHAEYESSGALGVEFGVLTDHLKGNLHLGPQLGFDEGVLGVWAERRDYAVGGLTYTPDT